MKQIYLDYNATTPIAPSVFEAIQPFLTRHYGNPSSSHAAGRASKEAIEDARTQVASLLGASREEIVFTSGGTESNNLAIKGALFAERAPGHLVISAIEHPAVTRPARFLEELGHELTVVRCGRNGVIDPEDVRRAIRADTRLVSIMHSNNEIGTLQPIAEIAKICREEGVLCHTDAAQSGGKVPTRCEELGVDLMTIAGHKFYAPKGVGALYIREGVDLEPLLHGADQEDGFRAGTENTPWIVGLGQASQMVAGCMDQTMERLSELRDLLHQEIESAAGCRIPVNGGSADRLPNTLSIRMPGVPGHVVLRGCPEVAASTGSACHSEHHNMSPVLAALGLDAQQASETIRLSVGWYTSEDDISVAANALVSAWQAARQSRS